MVTILQTNCRWLDGRVPDGFWDQRENRTKYMDWLAERCGFTSVADWYGVSGRDFRKNCGRGLLYTRFRDSVYQAVCDYRPDFDWLPWKFRTCPNGYWTDAANRCRYLNWLATELGLNDIEDWYSVTKRSFQQHSGGGLLRNWYVDSVYAAVVECQPHHSWLPWRFAEVPQSFWHVAEHRLQYMSWLGKRLGYRQPEDWYGITKSQICDNFGGGLLRTHYGDSPQRAVQELFPSTNLLPWRFVSVPNGFWLVAANRAKYLRWLRRTLNITASGWQKLKASDFRENDGIGLLRFYRSQSFDPAKCRATESLWHQIKAVESASARSCSDDVLIGLIS